MDSIRMAHVCVDRPLRLPQIQRASAIAADVRSDNRPAFVRELPAHVWHPEEMALLTGKLWPVGKQLSVGFMGGSKATQARVLKQMQQWSQYAAITFAQADPHDAEVRIAFRPGEGSWSYLGTDILSIPRGQETMNLGWIDDSTSDIEVRRVALHEAGHTLAMVHEHESPAEGIQWNKPAVYAFFSGPPNNWTHDEIDEQIFNKYAETVTQHTVFDPLSIMEYDFAPPLVLVRIPGNTNLSELDKSYIASVYPLSGTKPPPPPPPVGDLPVLVVGQPAIRGAIPGHGRPARFTLHKDKAGEFLIDAAIRGSARRAPIVTLSRPDGSDKLKLAMAQSHSDKGIYVTNPTVKAPSGDYLLSIYHPLAGHGGFCRVEAKYA
jgi:serralysin